MNQVDQGRLTRAEEEMMLLLWRLERALLKDIVEAYPAPKPAVSTISTLLRTLERKGFVGHKAYSKTFEYYVLVQKRTYLRAFFQDFFKKYFDGSNEELILFISNELGAEMQVPAKAEVQVKIEPAAEVDASQLSLW
jgi:BlaI family transcriptional regulator, penicillinase repressor